MIVLERRWDGKDARGMTSWLADLYGYERYEINYTVTEDGNFVLLAGLAVLEFPGPLRMLQPGDVLYARFDPTGLVPGVLADAAGAARQLAATTPPSAAAITGGSATVPGTMRRAAAAVSSLCHWTLNRGNVQLRETHQQFHYGSPCPYEAMAAVLRGEPDPRELTFVDEPNQEAMHPEGQYHVTWRMDVFGCGSPREAAESARRAQQAPDSIATVFEVVEARTGLRTEIDLTYGDQQGKARG